MLQRCCIVALTILWLRGGLGIHHATQSATVVFVSVGMCLSTCVVHAWCLLQCLRLMLDSCIQEATEARVSTFTFAVEFLTVSDAPLDPEGHC